MAKWISVKDGFPAEGEDGRSKMVEIKLANGEIMPSYRYNGGWCDRLGFSEYGWPDLRVAFWRPLKSKELEKKN